MRLHDLKQLKKKFDLYTAHHEKKIVIKNQAYIFCVLKKVVLKYLTRILILMPEKIPPFSYQNRNCKEV